MFLHSAVVNIPVLERDHNPTVLQGVGQLLDHVDLPELLDDSVLGDEDSQGLEDIEEDIKGVKTETNQRTNYMSDSSVLTHIRAGIGRLKAEAVELNLRLGTAENLIAAKISCEERRNLVGNDSSDDDGDD